MSNENYGVLTLQSEMTLGSLKTNAEDIKKYVLARLPEYTPENFHGRAAEAKAARTQLNQAEKMLNSRRLELEREYMAPFEAAKAVITDTCRAIHEASSRLDEIVKAEEERELAEKLEKIQEYWDKTGFALFDLSKVYQKSWTNKTAKLKEVYKELDDIQSQTLQNLKVLEQFPPEDIPLLKSLYIDTLDMSATISKANDLKQARDALASEQESQRQTAKRKAIAQQEADERQETKEVDSGMRVSSLVAAVTETAPKEDIMTYALVLHGTREQLLTVRRCMTSVGVTYTKLTETDGGLYEEAST
jgi:predicted transcriptional regulator